MAHKVFTDPFFSHNAVDLSAHVIGMSLEYSADEVEDTHAGDTTHLFLGGLLNWKLTVDFAQELAASGVDVTLFPDVGVSRAIIVRNDNSDGVGATNPNYTATGVLVEYPPIGVQIGELSVTRAVYAAGTLLTRAEA